MISPVLLEAAPLKRRMKCPVLIDVAGLDRAYDLIITELIRLLPIVDPNIKSFLNDSIR